MSSRSSLDEIKDQFLSQISHEFRSPLATIIGYLSLMERQVDSLSDRHREYVAAMKDSADRLKSFVDNLIDATQLEAGILKYAIEPLDIRAIMQSACEALRPQFDAHRMDVKVQCPSYLCAMADPEQLQKILRQMLSNAIQFTPDGGHITLWAKDGGPKSVLMGITDSGVGIPRAMFQRIFERFEQVPQTRHAVRKTHGTGLGLTVVKGLIENQGGHIWVQSSTRRGTTFCWMLPKPKRGHVAARVNKHEDRLAA